VRIGVFSDIHANWQALEAVLEHADPDTDAGLCLGDVVGYGGDPVKCVDEVRRRAWPSLVGNHDRACTDERILDWFNDDAAHVIRWTIEALGADRLQWLASLPESADHDGVLLVHASPRDPIFEYILDAATAAANLELLNGRACLHGHTHVPGYFYPNGDSVDHNYWLGKVRVAGPALINPGSVGQPRDGNPDASYAVWDTDHDSLEWRRVPYDREGAKKAILKAKLPERFASRLDVGR
jgi:diadenosine tetraphosphatase ApaH/serine/threonine PP2A family protein phosphatase